MSSFLAPKVVQRLNKEVLEIQKNKLDDISLQEVQDLSEICAIISGPQGTPFEGGSFVVKLTFDGEFPAKPPKGVFVTKIFHPNIAPKTGEICVNTLKRDWTATLGIRHVLLVIRCLMIEPNPDSALNADAGRLIQENFVEYEEKARMWTDIYAKSKKKEAAAPSNASPIKKSVTTPPATEEVAAAVITPASQDENAKENADTNSNVQATVASKTVKMLNTQATTPSKSPLIVVKKPTTATTTTTAPKRSTLKRL